MVSKAFLILCVQALLVKTAFTQTCGSGLSKLGSVNNYGLGSNLGIGSNFGLGNNIGLGSLSNTNIGAQPVLAQVSLASLLASTPASLLDSLSYGGTLSVATGSSIAPNGITILAENLAADGAVSVTGNVPFLGAVNVAGNVPSVGEAAVVYNTRPGVGLSSGGCGAGLGGVGLSGMSAGLSGLNGGGLSLSNGLSACGCAL